MDRCQLKAPAFTTFEVLTRSVKDTILQPRNPTRVEYMVLRLLFRYLTQVPTVNLRCRQFPTCGHLLNFGWCC
jgi:hypothetical protein